MRFSVVAPALLFGTLGTGAQALPISPLPALQDVHRVQMLCTPNSCIDQRTGVYTQSTCNAYGCRPMGRPVGRLPGYGGGQGYGGGPVYGGGGYRGGRYGGSPPPTNYNPPTCAEC